MFIRFQGASSAVLRKGFSYNWNYSASTVAAAAAGCCCSVADDVSSLRAGGLLADNRGRSSLLAAIGGKDACIAVSRRFSQSCTGMPKYSFCSCLHAPLRSALVSCVLGQLKSLVLLNSQTALQHIQGLLTDSVSAFGSACLCLQLAAGSAIQADIIRLSRTPRNPLASALSRVKYVAERAIRV